MVIFDAFLRFLDITVFLREKRDVRGEKKHGENSRGVVVVVGELGIT